jgi:hypothetical protein
MGRFPYPPCVAEPQHMVGKGNWNRVFANIPIRFNANTSHLTNHSSSIEIFLNGTYNISVLVRPLPNPWTGVRFMGQFSYLPCFGGSN